MRQLARAAVVDAVVDAREMVVRLRAGHVVVPPVEGPGQTAEGHGRWRNRWRRFLFGFTLPFVVGNACLHHAELGPPAQKVLRRQALLTAFFGCAWFWLFDFEDIETASGFTISFTSGATGAAALVGSLAVVEWFVIAFSREHHDKIGADVARLLGVPPDEDVVDPRVRLNTGWMWTKFKRRAQGVLVMVVSVLPSLVVVGIGLMILLPAFGDLIGTLVNVLIAAVVFYWVAVIALGKTSWAWRQDIDREPLPLHTISGMGTRSGWLFPFRLWAWALRRSMGFIVRPARHLEHLPWEGAGLALARLVMALPVVYVVVRPFFPVAATILLAARAPHLFVVDVVADDLVPVPVPVGALVLEAVPVPVTTSE